MNSTPKALCQKQNWCSFFSKCLVKWLGKTKNSTVFTIRGQEKINPCNQEQKHKPVKRKLERGGGLKKHSSWLSDKTTPENREWQLQALGKHLGSEAKQTWLQMPHSLPKYPHQDSVSSTLKWNGDDDAHHLLISLIWWLKAKKYYNN